VTTTIASYFKYDGRQVTCRRLRAARAPWGAAGSGGFFSFGEIAGDFAQFEPVLLMPCVVCLHWQKRAFKKFFCGPESFTHRMYAISSASRRNFANCSWRRDSTPLVLQSAGGIGKVFPNGSATGPAGRVCGRSTYGRNLPFQIKS